MEEQKIVNVVDGWTLKITYEDIPTESTFKYKRFNIVLIDTHYLSSFTIESNVCGVDYYYPISKAILLTKEYLKHRFNYDIEL
jgi:hypothetical protein